MPTNDRGVLVAATATEVQNREDDARRKAEQMAASDISDVKGRSDVHVRQLLPSVDLESGADNGWNGDDAVFVQSGLSAGYNETFTVDSNAKAEDKVIVIYAVTNKSGAPITTQIDFQTNTGGLFERAHLEGLETDEEDTLVFADPIALGSSQDVVIEQYAEEAGDDRVIFHGIVAEKAGNTIEQRGRFLSEA